MSCICCTCKEKIRLPDVVWYATSRYNPTTVYVCGTCLSLIPKHEREFVAEQQEFGFSFGPVYSTPGEVWIRNWQSLGSRQGAAVFTVKNEKVFADNLPNGQELIDELYPYFCLDVYMENMVKLYRQIHNDDSRILFAIVKQYIQSLSEWLGVPVTKGYNSETIKKDGKTIITCEPKATPEEITAVMNALLEKYQTVLL